MKHLHRTQVYLEDEQIGRLKLEAAKARLAVSELIRRAIDYFLKGREEKTNWDKDALVQAVGKIKLSSKDASSRHDDYLYGPKESR